MLHVYCFLDIMRIYNEIKSMFITVCFLSYVFLVSGLIINFLQLCSCVIWPFNKELYRKVNCYLALAIWSREYFKSILRTGLLILFFLEFTFFSQWWSNSDCVLYINPDDIAKVHSEHSIIM
jgi:lysophosphatidic acid acyltransferase/lysophosphatidylinositol acyltransferase